VQAREDLKRRGVSSIPVVIIEHDAEGEIIVTGFNPKRLIEVLKLDTKYDPASGVAWLADRYDKVLSATARGARQLSEEILKQRLPWNARTVAFLVAQIAADNELALMSYRTGQVTNDDMRQHYESAAEGTVTEIAQHSEKVRDDILAFLKDPRADFNRLVMTHKGGEVTVLEALRLSLGHGTYHLKQLYWLMQNRLAIKPDHPATEQDLEGIPVVDEIVPPELDQPLPDKYA
jgi:uncharacterized damage-inducible protein DinB